MSSQSPCEYNATYQPGGSASGAHPPYALLRPSPAVPHGASPHPQQYGSGQNLPGPSHEVSQTPFPWTAVWDYNSSQYYYSNQQTGKMSWDFPRPASTYQSPMGSPMPQQYPIYVAPPVPLFFQPGTGPGPAQQISQGMGNQQKQRGGYGNVALGAAWGLAGVPSLSMKSTSMRVRRPGLLMPSFFAVRSRLVSHGKKIRLLLIALHLYVTARFAARLLFAYLPSLSLEPSSAAQTQEKPAEPRKNKLLSKLISYHSKPEAKKSHKQREQRKRKGDGGAQSSSSSSSNSGSSSDSNSDSDSGDDGDDGADDGGDDGCD